MYGHVKAIAEAEQAGLKKAGIDADIFQQVCPLISDITP
jgi:NAD(P)H dehydrogenase (quinone)